MRTPWMYALFLAACGGKDNDYFPVDTGPDATGPTSVATATGGGTGTATAGTGTGGTDPDETADTGDGPPVVSFDGPARSLVMSELCDVDRVPGLSWVELYNAGEAGIDLGDYALRMYADGLYDGVDVPLPRQALPAGDTWVIVQGGYEGAFFDTWSFSADQVALPYELNGDDVLLLLDGGELVDAYGVIGEGIGGRWAYSDRTATRFEAVQYGSPRWLDAEWDLAFGANFATPGRHPATATPRPTGTTFPGTGAGTVLISEVVDYADDARVKYVELFNIGAAEVDLDGWTLTVTDGITGATTTTTLAGRIPAAGTWVVAAADGAEEFRAVFGFDADLYSGVASGNGDDAYELRGPGGQVDVYGLPGADGLGTDWDYTDAVVSRNPGVFAGADVWNPLEWFRSVGAGSASPGSHSGGGTSDPGVVMITELVDHIDDTSLRYVELYNPGPDPAVLGRFTLHRYADGSVSSESVRASGDLPAGSFYIIAYDEGAFSGRYGFTPHLSSTIVSGDGNDVYQLQLDGVPVDVWGEVGVDGFGGGWDYTDSVVLRDPLVPGPRASMNPSEWRVMYGSSAESPGSR